MTFIHGKNTRVVINGSDISFCTDSSDITDGRAVHMTTAYGPTRTRQSKTLGLGDGKISLKGTHDNQPTAARKVLQALMDADVEVPFLLQHQGAGSGLPQWSGNVVVASYNESIPVNDMIKWAAELEMSGPRSNADQP